MSDRERRHVALDSGASIRGAASASGGGIRGLTALFDQPTIIGGQFEEILRSTALDGVLRNDVRALFNHDPNFVLGRTTAGTLKIRKSASGLEYEVATLPKARADVLEAIERRDVTGNSFSFSLPKDGGGERWTDRGDGELPLREILRVERLFDVGPVTFPAYEATTVSARAQQMASKSPQELWVAEQRRRLAEAERFDPTPPLDAMSERERLASAAAESEFRIRQNDQGTERGLRRIAREADPAVLKRVAYHEAGHAVMAWATGGTPTEARVDGALRPFLSGGRRLAGVVRSKAAWRSPEVAMAGAAAEMLARVDSGDGGWQGDIQAAIDRGAKTEAQRRAALEVAERVLVDHWTAVDAVASALRERIVLRHDELEEIIWRETTERQRSAAQAVMQAGWSA